ncbi:cytochrome P450 [Dongia deserti]|uniref:cytochrome P450 n=1 Tax=Dongia deserti TaxID=2268030 RepID=UPI000E65874B|nr:cytochrome P450 [Dongia deserti]
MTTFAPTDNGHADLSSHDSFLAGAPHNTFARMRREEPLAWNEMTGGKGFWSVTRHADVLELNRNYELLSSARGIRMEDQTHEEYMARRTFQETDPPEHSRTRVLVSKAFSKPVVAQFEGQIRAICDSILDDVIARGAFDAVKDVARQLPMRMLGQIIGVPEADLDWLVEKGDQLIANTDPEFTEHVLDKADTDAYRLMPFRSPAGAELFDYAKALMRDKEQRGDTSGVLHLILQPDSHGNVISEIEFRNFFCLLVAAGNDTTRYSIAASLYALANRPELATELKDGDAQIWETAPDELIRWASPTMHFRRTATRDFEMHGKRVRAGDKVLLWFVSANRDETAFDKPFEINLRRSPNRHVAFGQGGPHVCLGMWLARLEVRILLQELVKRIARVEQTGPHEFLRSNFIGGIKRLPVRIHH